VRALVLGATGHVGHAFTRELLARGFEVTAASRSRARWGLLAGLPVRLRSGDDATPGRLAEWVRGHDLVVDAAAPYALRLAPAPRARLLCAAEQRMDALLESVRAARARLVFVSSFTTSQRPRSALGSAQAALLARLHPYFVLKSRMEDRVREAARRGLEAVIVNPTHCFGPYDARPLELCLVPLVLRGELPAVHAHPMNVIDVRDVAEASLTAVEQGCFAEPLPLYGHNTTVHGLAAAICRRAGATPPRQRVPAGLVASAAYGGELLGLLGANPWARPSLWMLLALEQHWGEPGPVQRQLLPRLRPLSRTLADAIAWYTRIGHLPAPPGPRAESVALQGWS
jgi:nucleoside-diphosphate-sugar epimerase